VQKKRLALVGITLAGLAACQRILGIEDERGVPRAATTEGGRAPACELFAPPPPEVADDDVTGVPLVFAVRRIDLTPPGPPLGFDLDGQCTRGDADVPCLGSPDDLDGGVDNALREGLGAVGISGDLDPAAAGVNAELREGKYGLLFVLKTFNRTRTDRSLTLHLVASPGMERLCVEPRDAATPTTVPVFPPLPYHEGGCEVWSLGKFPAIASIFDENGAPASLLDGKLVARFRELAFALGPLSFRLEDAVLSATLTPEAQVPGGPEFDGDRGAVLEGVLAGRVAAEAMITAVRQTTFPPINTTISRDGGPLCNQSASPLYDDILRAAVCRGRDVPLAGDPPTARCRGVSIAIGFRATRVVAGTQGSFPDASICERPFDASCGASE